VKSEFHPEFCAPARSKTVVLKNGVGPPYLKFHFSLPLLLEASGFFRDIFSLNLSATSDTPYELPLASAEGLALALRLLGYSYNREQHLSVEWPPLGTLENLAIIADAYDFPEAVKTLCRVGIITTAAQCFGRFVLEVQAHPAHSSFTAAARKTVLYDIKDISPTSLKSLESKPKALIALYSAHLEWKDIMSKFKAAYVTMPPRESAYSYGTPAPSAHCLWTCSAETCKNKIAAALASLIIAALEPVWKGGDVADMRVNARACIMEGKYDKTLCYDCRLWHALRFDYHYKAIIESFLSLSISQAGANN
jgi:hypothetical protein